MAWVSDSGASAHMAFNREIFQDFSAKGAFESHHRQWGILGARGQGDVVLDGEFGTVVAADVLWSLNWWETCFRSPLHFAAEKLATLQGIGWSCTSGCAATVRN